MRHPVYSRPQFKNTLAVLTLTPEKIKMSSFVGVFLGRTAKHIPHQNKIRGLLFNLQRNLSVPEIECNQRLI